jgi:hypothetical protein
MQTYLLQIFLIASGLLLFLRTMRSLARKKITETISMFWGVLSFLFVLAGILLIPLDWSQYITTGALIIVALGFSLGIYCMFYFSMQLSDSIRKTQELAIQVSLLNQEHSKVSDSLCGLLGQSGEQIWRTNTMSEQYDKQAGEGDVSHEECSVYH